MFRAALAGLLGVVQAADWHYYLSDNVDWTSSFAGGTIEGWEGEHDGENDMVLFYPAAQRMTLNPGASWPAAGMSFYMDSDVTWVVANGTVTFGANASESHIEGDVFWASAGSAHGPIVNVGSEKLLMLGVTGGGRKALVPKSLPAPVANPSTSGSVTATRSYRNATAAFRPNPSPHTDECMTNGGVWNKNFPGKDMSPPVLRVNFYKTCSIPWHNHPTGALYFITQGSMAFEGDKDGVSTKFNVGDVRWVRPGFTYGPEHNIGDGLMSITVMGTDTPPNFLPNGTKPAGPYQVRKQVYVNHVYDDAAHHAYEI